MRSVVRRGDIVGLCALALLLLGVLMVNSAGFSVGEAGGVTFWSIVTSKHALYAAVAVGLMLLLSRAPIGRLAAPDPARRFGTKLGERIGLVWPTALLVTLCVLVYIPGVGREINGAKRWIGAPAPLPDLLSFQPSEVAKWGMVLVIALYAAARPTALRFFWRGLAPALCAVGAVAAVIALEDLGTAVLIAAACSLVLIAGGACVWHFAALAPLGLLAVTAAVLARPYRMQRLATFLDPFADPSGAGYHMIQSLTAVANGKVFGRGLGFGLQKFGYLPADGSDFLFAVICEELGIVGALVVISLYAAILVSGWGIARRHPSRVVQLAGLGILATLGLQAVFNLMVVTGLGPTKGIALPLLSAGGTGWLLTAATLGLLMAAERDVGEIAPDPERAEVEQKTAPLIETRIGNRAPA